MAESCESRDLTRRKLFWWMWVLSALLVAAQFLWPSANGWFAAALLFSWAAFCGSNAWRCRRLHCYVTTPVCLLGGLYLVLAELGLEPFRISRHYFNALVLGPIVLSCLAEKLFGKYARKVPP